jgi:hypothetical protein
MPNMVSRITHAVGVLLSVGVPVALSAQAPAKPAEKPKAPLVIVVGCAKPGSQPTIWTLSNVSERTEAPTPALNKAETEQATARTLGSETYDLVGIADFVAPDASRKVGNRTDILAAERVNTTGKLAAGHKVIIKGLYVAGATPRINVTSVVDLAPSCP